MGLVDFWGASRVGKDASSLSNLAVTFSSSCLVVASSLSGLAVAFSLFSLTL